MLRGILPKEYAFFDYFNQMIDTDKQISDLLVAMMSANDNRTELSKQIRQFVHRSDFLSKSSIELLHKTFITPIDRNEIFTLVKRLDNLADHINAAAFRVSAYDVNDIRMEAVEFSRIIQSCIEVLVIAINDLNKLKNKNQILDCCKRVHEFEYQADEIHREAISRLFKDGELLLLIKWKEIFERLEKAVDKCEDIACIIESILIEDS
jgi:hypothetical protein